MCVCVCSYTKTDTVKQASRPQESPYAGRFGAVHALDLMNMCAPSGQRQQLRGRDTAEGGGGPEMATRQGAEAGRRQGGGCER